MIGVIYSDKYAVTETFQLLKIPWEWYDPSREYDVVIADARALESVPKNLIDLTKEDLFAQVSEMLNRGDDHNHEPSCEVILNRLRERLKQHTILLEIPPVPWGYSFTVAVTHDVDTTSTRERGWLSVGYAVYTCLRHGQIADALHILLAKLGWGKDPWNQFNQWIALEHDMKIRSTFFFIPFKDRPGISCPGIRAARYELDPAVIGSLLAGGWEIGVHGIDNWINDARADEELRRFEEFGTSSVGTRVHWLLFGDDTWRILDEAGFYYDSTFGYNEDIGFRAGTLQVYRPRTARNLLELPLHIQDMGLFGSFCWSPSDGGWRRVPCLHLDDEDARRWCNRIFAYSRKYGGVVTMLWHYESIAPPRRWTSFFRYLVREAVESGAWVTRAIDAVEWFKIRREVWHTCVREANTVAIQIHRLRLRADIPPLVLRLHVPGAVVESVDAEFVKHKDYVDIRCDQEHITVVLR